MNRDEEDWGRDWGIRLLLTVVFIAVIVGIVSPEPKQQLSGKVEVLTKQVEVLTKQVNTLSQQYAEVDAQNKETLKRWKDIENSYKSMYEVFNNQFGSNGRGF